MGRARKSKRVSWAPGPNLCQVKLFLSDDCPSEVSVAKEHILIKQHSQILEHSDGLEDDDVPPGFENMAKLRKAKQEAPPQSSKIAWSCPPKFDMRSEWLVAAGEESDETNAQKLREMGVIAAKHPHLWKNPILPVGAGAEHWDDSPIPVIPIEEEEVAADIEPNSEDSSNPTGSSHVPEPLTIQNSALPFSDADLFSALAVLLKIIGQRSLIDPDLLVKIFSDPEMNQKLVNSYSAAAVATPPTATVAPVPCLIPPPCGTPIPDADGSSHDVPISTNPASNRGTLPAIPDKQSAPYSAANFRSVNQGTEPIPPPYTVPVPEIDHVSVPVPMPDGLQPVFVDIPLRPFSKDMTFFTDLVKEPGEDKQQNGGFGTHNVVIPNKALKQKLLVPKHQMPCFYFKRAAGCRNGSKCPFKHGTLLRWQSGDIGRASSAKRMKFGE